MPSENFAASTSPAPDRRTRKRDARRDHLLDLAADLVEHHGVDGVTMAALADAADYAPASLYTYFASRSALLAALQQRALVVLADVAQQHLAAWDRALTDRDATEPALAALARLWAFSDLFLAAPHTHAREFRLQQQLLVSVGAEDGHDAAQVVPVAMAVLDVPRRLLDAAALCGALRAHGAAADPIEEPIDGSVLRTFAWVVALNGALMADGLTTGLPTTGTALGGELTAALLVGWGADPDLAGAARVLAARLAHTEGTR
ncbi:MAG: TetR family transcriptional regulator [Microthrixaceae bacterium]